MGASQSGPDVDTLESMAIAVLLLIVIPIVELYAFVQVTHAIGFGSALLALILVSVFGAWLVKREGIGMWRRMQQQLSRGEPPGTRVLDGLLLLVAGVLIVVPGFVTAAIGLLLLLPPVRAVARAALARRYGGSTRVIVATHGPRIVDTSAEEHPAASWPPRGQLEP
jgi:UPF0716 protein FxsA